MKRWRISTGEDIENPAIDKFLEEIKEVCKKHNFSISHEDGHGAFLIEDYSDGNIKWLFDATDNTEIALEAKKEMTFDEVVDLLKKSRDESAT